MRQYTCTFLSSTILFILLRKSQLHWWKNRSGGCGGRRWCTNSPKRGKVSEALLWDITCGESSRVWSIWFWPSKKSWALRNEIHACSTFFCLLVYDLFRMKENFEMFQNDWHVFQRSFFSLSLSLPRITRLEMEEERKLERKKNLSKGTASIYITSWSDTNIIIITSLRTSMFTLDLPISLIDRRYHYIVAH